MSAAGEVAVTAAGLGAVTAGAGALGTFVGGETAEAGAMAGVCERRVWFGG